MFTQIRIEKLFGMFDYDIELKSEDITILTGPNGYGKTTVLKIIDALASQNSLFFMTLLFQKITCCLSDGKTITLMKMNKYEVEVIVNKDKPFRWNEKSLNRLIRSTFPHFRQVEEQKWLDRRTDNIVSLEGVLQKLASEHPELAEDFRTGNWTKQLKIPHVYFIREQRLLRPIVYNGASLRHKLRHRAVSFDIDESTNVFNNTIEEYAKELSGKIEETLAKSTQVTQELDSSFPRRLFDQEHGISEEEFNRRFNQVKEIQKALSAYNISDIKEDSHPTYKDENAQALHVYINDTEKKLAVFKELLGKLKTFTSILNERRFAFKHIAISKEEGFQFFTDQDIPLALADLSSGEQQEVVLLYELLFKVEPGTLVLIDEPELSLHIVWQKQFLDDMFDIIALQKMNVVIATHSPQIINNHWDLTVDLEDLHNAEVSN
jgi:predicted ATP-binding protein involved in virulence